MCRRLDQVLRRDHALHLDPGGAFRRDLRRRHPRHDRGKDPSRHARRRRWVRRQAERVRGGARDLRGIACCRTAGEVGRGPLRVGRRDDSRSRPAPGGRGRSRRRRQDHRVADARRAEQRRLSPAPDPVDRPPDAVHGAGPVRHPERLDPDRPGVHEHHADRRLPRRRAARGDPRSGAVDGSDRRRARRRSGRAAAEELDQGVPVRERLRAVVRLRSSTRSPSTARSSSPTTPRSPTVAPSRRRAASCAASASRAGSRSAGSRRPR